MRQRNIKKYLIRFRKHLPEERGNAGLIVKSHLTGVKSFYQTFDIEIPTLPELRYFGAKLTVLWIKKL
jgi:hypothetical protein